MKKIIFTFVFLTIANFITNSALGRTTWDLLKTDGKNNESPQIVGEAEMTTDDVDPCSSSQYAQEYPDSCNIEVIAKVVGMRKWTGGSNQCQVFLTTLDENRITGNVPKSFDPYSATTCNLLYHSMLTGKFLKFLIVPTVRDPGGNSTGLIYVVYMTESSDPNQDMNNWSGLPGAF